MTKIDFLPLKILRLTCFFINSKKKRGCNIVVVSILYKIYLSPACNKRIEILKANIGHDDHEKKERER